MVSVVWHAKVPRVAGGILLAWEASNRGFDNKSEGSKIEKEAMRQH